MYLYLFVIILVAGCKTMISPVIMHWRYHILALNHRYMGDWFWSFDEIVKMCVTKILKHDVASNTVLFFQGCQKGSVLSGLTSAQRRSVLSNSWTAPSQMAPRSPSRWSLPTHPVPTRTSSPWLPLRPTSPPRDAFWGQSTTRRADSGTIPRRQGPETPSKLRCLIRKT